MCHEIYHPSFGNYNRRKLGMDLCNACAHKYFAGETISKVKMSHAKYSLYDWCIENVSDEFIKDYWSEKNTVDPHDLSYRSHNKIWIKCPAGIHEDYETCCRDFTVKNNFSICPQCTCVVSQLQMKVNDYLVGMFGEKDVTHEGDCSISPINPKTGAKLRYDNCIESMKFIIEVHGEQHYKITSWLDMQAKAKGITSEEIFAYNQWKDEYKKEYALSHGYEYLAIPYTVEKDDTYKQLIDAKIADINNKLKEKETCEYEVN